MKRNPNLDVIRAVLASWIVMVHSLWFSGIHGGFPAASARLTVDAFIILSGYVITKSLLIKRASYWGFIGARFWRLFPAFAICLGFALLVRPLTFHSTWTEFAREELENEYFWPQVFAHLSLLYGLIPEALLPKASTAFIPTAWSISLEMQLYLLAPLILMAIYRFRWRAILLCSLSGLAFFPPLAKLMAEKMSLLGAFFPQKLFFFLCGMALALANRPFWVHQKEAIALLPLPGFRWCAMIGVWSYSLYLIHYPVLHLVKAALPECPPRVGALLLAGIGYPVSVALAALLYRWVEVPGIAFGRSLGKRKV